MDAPIINIAQAPPRLRECLHKGLEYSGNFNDKIETHEEANDAVDRCCEEDYRLCRPAHSYLTQEGYAIRKNLWLREPIEIKQAPQKYQVFLEKGDTYSFLTRDGWINTDDEMHYAFEACERDILCDHREMYRYFVRIEEPHLEERALILLFFPSLRIGSGTFSTKLLGTNQFDVPTHPDDVGMASAGGPIEVNTMDSWEFQSHLTFGLDFWQYAFVKAQIRLKDDSKDLSCVRQRYANDYDAYTTVCFEQRRSDHLTVGFYPLIWGLTRQDYSRLFMGFRDDDLAPSKETMFSGLLFSAEAGLASAEFKYHSGWHRWGRRELDDSMTITRDRFGLTAGANARLSFGGRHIMLGFLEAGLSVDYFPDAYYDIMFNIGLPVGVMLDINE